MLNSCAFQTERLQVAAWATFDLDEIEAGNVLLVHISEESRQYLPESLASVRTTDDSIGWLDQQRNDGTAVLFAQDLASEEMIGILIAAEQPEESSIKMYIGYLISPLHQGRGMATELVCGFVKWSDKCARIDAVVAGVDSSHTASRSVMAKAGFVSVQETNAAANYLTYERLPVR